MYNNNLEFGGLFKPFSSISQTDRYPIIWLDYGLVRANQITLNWILRRREYTGRGRVGSGWRGGGGGRGREWSGLLRNGCERERVWVWEWWGRGEGEKPRDGCRVEGGGEGGHVIRVGGDPSSHLSPGSWSINELFWAHAKFLVVEIHPLQPHGNILR